MIWSSCSKFTPNTLQCIIFAAGGNSSPLILFHKDILLISIKISIVTIPQGIDGFIYHLLLRMDANLAKVHPNVVAFNQHRANLTPTLNRAFPN